MGAELKVLVIGGGPAGMEAALRLGQAGIETILVEKEEILGGMLNMLVSSFPRGDDPALLRDEKIRELTACPKVNILCGTGVESCRREARSLTAVVKKIATGEAEDVSAAAVVLATGSGLFDCSRYGEYGYGIYPGVMNSLEFETKVREKEPLPQAVSFIKCVGSRDRSKGHPYCSKICCMISAKQAGLVKRISPGTKAYVFYMDYRAAGKGYEEFVRDVIEQKGVRYIRGRPAKVLPSGKRLLIRAEDTLMGVPIEVETDWVVLMAAFVAKPETLRLAEQLGIKLDRYGFPEDEWGAPGTSTPGVFFAGACGFPIETRGALDQGAAVAARVINFLKGSGLYF